MELRDRIWCGAASAGMALFASLVFFSLADRPDLVKVVLGVAVSIAGAVAAVASAFFAWAALAPDREAS